MSRMIPLLATLFLLAQVGLAAAEDGEGEKVQYTGTYTNPEWEGGKMTIVIAREPVDGRRPGSVNCIWGGDFYSYPGSFEPQAEDGTLVGTCEAEDGMGEPTTYVIKGTVDDEGTYSALYWVQGADEPSDADEADGTMTLTLGATPQVTEDSQ